MKTMDLFNDEKQNLTQQVEVKAKKEVLPFKYCPNCGMKHTVQRKEVELENFPKGVKHLMYFIECPDEDGSKVFGKFVAPVAANVVNMDYFVFTLKDLI